MNLECDPQGIFVTPNNGICKDKVERSANGLPIRAMCGKYLVARSEVLYAGTHVAQIAEDSAYNAVGKTEGNVLVVFSKRVLNTRQHVECFLVSSCSHQRN